MYISFRDSLYIMDTPSRIYGFEEERFNFIVAF